MLNNVKILKIGILKTTPSPIDLGNEWIKVIFYRRGENDFNFGFNVYYESGSRHILKTPAVG